MTEINDGGPIFPTTVSRDEGGNTLTVPANGMSMRDWFAGQAMSRLLDTCRGDNFGVEFVDHVAAHSYRVADAMIRAREASR